MPSVSGCVLCPSTRIRGVEWRTDVKGQHKYPELNSAPLRIDGDTNERWLAGALRRTGCRPLLDAIKLAPARGGTVYRLRVTS